MYCRTCTYQTIIYNQSKEASSMQTCAGLTREQNCCFYVGMLYDLPVYQIGIALEFKTVLEEIS